ncbi:hypothetical protein D3C81_1900620 [compost metagenome]
MPAAIHWLSGMSVMRSIRALTAWSSSGVSSVSATRRMAALKSDADWTISSPTNSAGILPLQFGPTSRRRTGPGALNWLPIMCHQRE